MAREIKAYVFIYLPGETVAVPAGVFSHYPDDGIGSFTYGRRYLERPDALPVDPVALPLGTREKTVSTNSGVYGAFRDASPDYWGRLVIAADAGVAPEALGEMDFLLRSNASRVGNLDFRESLEQGEAGIGPPAFRSLGDLMDAAQRLQEGREVGRDVLRLLYQGSSVGGARPKCTVEMDGALWIAKFPAGGDTLNFPRIEHATLLLAKKCGIEVPEARLVTIGKAGSRRRIHSAGASGGSGGEVRAPTSGGKVALLVKRFDREKAAKGYLRSGFVSALSLMEWDERDRSLWSYPAIADGMRAAFLAGRQETGQLFRRMVFNVLCRNTDDHPRNHGFLRGARGYALAPAYDIVPAPTRPGVGTEFSLSMSVGTDGRSATLSNAESLAPRFGLNHREARTLITAMRARVKGWEKHYRALGVSARDVEAIRGCFPS